jgi:hypothetical protein
LLWWEHYKQNNLLVKDRLFSFSLWDERENLVAIAPLFITNQPSIGPFRMRRLRFFGTDANVTEMRGLICDPLDEKMAVGALSMELSKHIDQWDFMNWDGLKSLYDISKITSTGRCVDEQVIPDFLFYPTGDYKAKLPRNVKESIRKCYNSLKRDGHQFEFRVVQGVEESAKALECFFRLHETRADLKNTIKHGNVFASIRAKSFLRNYSRSMAERGEFRVFQLVIAGDVVASRLGFVLGDELYLYFSGYLPEWGRYSVMTTTLCEILNYASQQQFRVVNLSPGNDVSKTRWRPEEVSIHRTTWLSPTSSGQLVFRAFRELERVQSSSSIAALLRPLHRQT